MIYILSGLARVTTTKIIVNENIFEKQTLSCGLFLQKSHDLFSTLKIVIMYTFSNDKGTTSTSQNKCHMHVEKDAFSHIDHSMSV